MLHNRTHEVSWHPCNVLSLQHAKYPPNWCCTVMKVSVHTRGHVAATYPWDVYPQHFHVCANVVILSLLHVPATRPCYMSPQCVLHTFFVPATCRCDMSLQHDPSCLPTLRPLCPLLHQLMMRCTVDVSIKKKKKKKCPTKSRTLGPLS